MTVTQTSRILAVVLGLSLGVVLLAIVPMSRNFMHCGSVFLCAAKDRCTLVEVVADGGRFSDH